MANVNTGPYRTITLPPNSTGEIAGTIAHYHLSYDNGTIDFIAEDILEGGTSGATAKILAVRGSTNNGELVILYTSEYPEFVEFQAGENLKVNSVVRAKAGIGAATPVNSPLSVIGSGDNPLNKLTIDSKGAANIRYEEGPQQLDSFGLTRQTSPSLIAQYSFEYDGEDFRFTDEFTGTGALAFDIGRATVTLTVGSDSGASSIRTSDRYHILQEGFGQLIEMSVIIGDSGKTDNTRRWGYFDERNGIFFEMNGTGWYLVKRSDITGSVVDTRLGPDDWNGDPLTGEGLSGMIADPTTLNLYWADLQSNGNFRMGLYGEDGDRVIVHTFHNLNTSATSYLHSYQLPVRAECFNTALTSGSSSITLRSFNVKSEGRLSASRARLSSKFSFTASPPFPLNNATWSPLFGFRAAEFFKGQPNRKYFVPELLTGNTSGGGLALKVVKNPTVLDVDGGALVWFPLGGESILEAPFTHGFTSTGGTEMITWAFNEGSFDQEMPQNFGLLGHNLVRKANGDPGDEYWIFGKSVGGAAATGTITAVAGSALIDGETFVINDGINPAVTFEFDSDGSVIETATLRAVNFTGAYTVANVRAAIEFAIQLAHDTTTTFEVVARPISITQLSLVCGFRGTQSNIAVTETVTDGGFVVTGLAGGTDADISLEMFPTWIELS